MANTAQAKKRVRQAEQNRQRNVSARSRLRTEIKKVIKAIESGDKAEASNALRAATSVIDSSARKRIIHTNKAARHKSRLNAHIRAMPQAQ